MVVFLCILALALLAACIVLKRQNRLLKADRREISSSLDELGNQELEMKDNLQRKYSDIGWLRSMLTHNIRMPLSVIDGYGQLLLSDAVPEEKKKECLKKICGNVAYLNRMVALVLDGKGGAVSYNFRRINLIQCIREVCTYVENATKKAGVGIYMNTNLDLLEIEADYIQIMRIFYNIFENSLKHTSFHNSIVITVDKIEEEALVIYKDNGNGMAREETMYIFEANYQGSNQKEGTGMGMSFVKEAVEAHHGAIYVESDIGKGMRIVMRFPVKQNL